MVDSFINYGNQELSSPTYLNKQEEDAFTFDFNPNDQFRFMHFNQEQFAPNVNHHPSQPDAGSNQSTYSTTHSSKHSPAYTPNTGDQYGDEDPYSKVPPIVRKGIRKFYEPILDGGTIFKYEDDPNEYRKARKRIQNRESATRVRNRKKNHVEILEDEITILKQEKAELKVITSKLMAENNMLKQQISFLERRNSHNPRPNQVDERELALRDEGVLIDDPEHPGVGQVNNYGYYRNAPAHKFKRHIALLGVFTLMLCVYGLLPQTGLANMISVFGGNNTKGLVGSDAVVVTTSTSEDISVYHKNNKNQPPRGPRHPKDDDIWSDRWDKNRRQSGHSNNRHEPGDWNNNSNYSWIITTIEITVLVGYLGYLLYVGVSFWKHQNKKRSSHDNSTVDVVSI